MFCRGRLGRLRSIDLRATRPDHHPSPVASFTSVFPLVVCLCGSSYQPAEFTEILIVAIGFCQPPLPPNSLVYNHARLGRTLLSPSRPPSPSPSRSNGPALRAHHFIVEQVQRALYILSNRHHRHHRYHLYHRRHRHHRYHRHHKHHRRQSISRSTFFVRQLAFLFVRLSTIFTVFFYRFTGLLFRVVSYAFPYVSYTLSSHPIPFSYVFSVRTYVRLSWLRLVAIQQPRIAERNVVARSTRSAHSARV